MLTADDIAILEQAGGWSPVDKPLAEWGRADWFHLAREAADAMVLRGIDQDSQRRRSELLASSINGMFPESSPWQDIDLGSERYAAYLQSSEWRDRVRLVRNRSGGVCERCGLADHEHTHHLTYERLYHEPLTDLVGVCRECHATIHGRATIDPATVEPMGLEEQLRLLATIRSDDGFRRRLLRALGLCSTECHRTTSKPRCPPSAA